MGGVLGDGFLTGLTGLNRIFPFGIVYAPIAGLMSQLLDRHVDKQKIAKQ
jgi:hypothetical protein